MQAHRVVGRLPIGLTKASQKKKPDSIHFHNICFYQTRTEETELRDACSNHQGGYNYLGVVIEKTAVIA